MRAALVCGAPLAVRLVTQDRPDAVRPEPVPMSVIAAVAVERSGLSRPKHPADGRQSDDQRLQLGDIVDVGDRQSPDARNPTGFP